MYKIKEAVIVEGVYDKIKLSSFLDGIIITTHGFAVYSNEDYIKTIQKLSEETGIVILTDSDSAGFRIRNFIKQKVSPKNVKHAYVPDIEGVERRKDKASKEGLLGVEGMSPDVILKALKDAGCTIDNYETVNKTGNISKSDMYRLGLTGGSGARNLREIVSKKLGIPAKISSNMLLDVLNRMISLDELEWIVKNTQKDSD